MQDLAIGTGGAVLQDLISNILGAGTREEFMGTIRVPFLLQVPVTSPEARAPGEAARGAFPTRRLSENPAEIQGGNTLSLSPDAIMSLERARGVQKALVHLCRPQDGGHRVSIGRAPECDVVLPESSVSKRHAEMHVDTLQLVDLESSNGTWLDGERMQSGVLYPLRDKQNLWFSGYQAILLSPKQLYRLAERMGKR